MAQLGALEEGCVHLEKAASLAESPEAPHGLAVARLTWSLEHRGGERRAAGWGWELGLGLRGFLNERAAVGWSLAHIHAPEVLFTGRRGGEGMGHRLATRSGGWLSPLRSVQLCSRYVHQEPRHCPEGGVQSLFYISLSRAPSSDSSVGPLALHQGLSPVQSAPLSSQGYEMALLAGGCQALEL